MEIDLKRIDPDADVYDVRKVVELVLHGSAIYDPNDESNKGRNPNFEVVMGKSRAGHIHDGTAILRVPTEISYRFFRWKRSDKNDIVVRGQALLVSGTPRKVPPGVEQMLNKALYIGPGKDKLRGQIGHLACQLCSRVAQVQVCVWYRQGNPPQNQGGTFSSGSGRVFPRHNTANISIIYEHKLIRIEGEMEGIKYFLVKFAIIRKLDLGFHEFGQPFIIFDLHVPPNFEQESRAPGIIERNGRYKARSRISALDDAHARVAPYAHHRRVLLAGPDNLIKFEMICHIAQCEPRPPPGEVWTLEEGRSDATAEDIFASPTDAISCAFMPLVQSTLSAATEPRGVENGQAKELHAHYVREMQYICMTHTLVNAVRLTEEEVVLGMVLARCAQPRWRTDRSYRMQVHAEGPVQDVCAQIVPSDWPLEDMVRAGLSNVRAVSSWAQHRGNKEFMEFLVVVAGVVLDRLERLGELLEAYVRAIEKVLYEG